MFLLFLCVCYISLSYCATLGVWIFQDISHLSTQMHSAWEYFAGSRHYSCFSLRLGLQVTSMHKGSTSISQGDFAVVCRQSMGR